MGSGAGATECHKALIPKRARSVRVTPRLVARGCAERPVDRERAGKRTTEITTTDGANWLSLHCSVGRTIPQPVLCDSLCVLSHKTQTNLANAETYFDEHLRVGDYYSQDDQVMGQWQGRGAEQLGLCGTVKRDDFLRLCQNLNPQTGERLTQRHKTTRAEGGREVANDGSFSTSPSRRPSRFRCSPWSQRTIG